MQIVSCMKSQSLFYVKKNKNYIQFVICLICA